jgi:NAD-dependent dihydropyrimidine dehydrogenase PreA subunit
VIDERPPPNRLIYCLDLRASNKSGDFVAEIKRIHHEQNIQIVGVGGLNGKPQASSSNGAPAVLSPGESLDSNSGPSVTDSPGRLQRIDDGGTRRWYPVIDYSRCTNCMECIDFCLYGVYGVDGLDRILVEEQENSKKVCPACSRVCPENAIIFPQHKTASIAGAPGEIGNLKIDLSQLFGAPTALELAAQERDTELVADGRDAVGMTVGIPKRQTDHDDQPRDELDDMLDDLDSLNL